MASIEIVSKNKRILADVADWAHFEDFCRRLTQTYASVQIYTGPLYLPRQYPDGKWRVTYEVIGDPPSVAVPTHFFKVIVAEGKNGQAGGPVSVGAFVLPNQEIENSTALTAFSTPIEAVERYSSPRFRVSGVNGQGEWVGVFEGFAGVTADGFV
jgi:endonuclease G